MNNNTSNTFCKKYVYKYIECLNINYQVFGKEHGKNMCYNIKEILQHCDCSIENEFNMTLEEIENKLLNLPNPSRSN
jgi:hypothetical protein